MPTAAPRRNASNGCFGWGRISGPRRRPDLPALAAASVLLGLTGVCIYRARTQSVIYDEAFTYLAFLSGSPADVLTEYTANNHVLFSILARISVGALTVSEFTLRLPTILASVLYFGTIFTICRSVLGRGWLFVVTVMALSLNPFILDHLSIARGYGLALALFAVALHQIIGSLTSDAFAVDRRWVVAAIALALSVFANLTFLVPAIALGTMALAAGAVTHGSGDRPGYWRDAILRFGLPAVGLGCALLAAPLSQATSAHFFFGAMTLERAATSLVEASLWYDAGAWPISAPDVPAAPVARVVTWGGLLPVGVVMAASVGTAVVRLFDGNGWSGLAPVDRCLLVVCGTLGLTLAQLVGAHTVFDVPYPFARTGLYLILLFVLAMATTTRKMIDSGHRFQVHVARVMCALLLVSVGRFGTEFNVAYYYEWRYDAGTRRVYDSLLAHLDPNEIAPIKVAASGWLFAPALNFYRVVRQSPRILPIDDGWQSNEGYDFFVVSPPDLERIRPVTDPVYLDPVSGVSLRARRRLP